MLKFLSTLSLRRATTLLLCHLFMPSQISIHALLAESDNRGKRKYPGQYEFLSTLSLRRATPMPITSITTPCYFYPRSPCGERRRFPCSYAGQFQISIHALLAESDLKKFPPMCIIRHFYPRSPCGERRFAKIMIVSSGLFLSTLSLRRATLGRGEVV